MAVKMFAKNSLQRKSDLTSRQFFYLILDLINFKVKKKKSILEKKNEFIALSSGIASW